MNLFVNFREKHLDIWNYIIRGILILGNVTFIHVFWYVKSASENMFVLYIFSISWQLAF